MHCKLAKINTLEDRRMLHLKQTAFKLSLDPLNLDNRQIFTRLHDARLLLWKRPRNPLYTKSLEYRLATLWNSLSEDIRQIDNHTTFDTHLEEFYRLKLVNMPTG